MISQLMCITADNATSNSKFAECFAIRTINWDDPFAVDRWINCMSHVIHLAVTDALKEIDHLTDKVTYFYFIFHVLI